VAWASWSWKLFEGCWELGRMTERPPRPGLHRLHIVKANGKPTFQHATKGILTNWQDREATFVVLPRPTAEAATQARRHGPPRVLTRLCPTLYASNSWCLRGFVLCCIRSRLNITNTSNGTLCEYLNYSTMQKHLSGKAFEYEDLILVDASSLPVPGPFMS
jgi:hypothetical protein